MIALYSERNTHLIWEAVNQAHSEHHHGNTIEQSQVLIASHKDRLVSTEHHPHSYQEGHEEDDVEQEVLHNVSNQLPKDGYQWTHETKGSDQLQ